MTRDHTRLTSAVLLLCCSTFGINGDRWKYAARTAVTTLQASIGGGLAGMSLSWYKNHRLEIGDVVNSVLGALVSITGRSYGYMFA